MVEQTSNSSDKRMPKGGRQYTSKKDGFEYSELNKSLDELVNEDRNMRGNGGNQFHRGGRQGSNNNRSDGGQWVDRREGS